MEIKLIEKTGELTTYLEKVGLSDLKMIAADFEGESNLHRYGIHLCLIQLRLNGSDIIIDPITIVDLQPVKEILENPEIVKVMFCAEFDVKLLKHTKGIQIRNIYDVQAGFKLLGYEKLGLENLVSEVLKIDKSQLLKKQKSDWNKRPLDKDQIEYAVNDVKYLFEMKKYLDGRLSGKQKKELQQINAGLENCAFVERKNPHLGIKGSGALNYSEKIYLKHLYQAREKVAQKIDFPAYWVVDNRAMLKLARIQKFDQDYFREKINFPKRAAALQHLFEDAFNNAADELMKKNMG